MAQDDYNVDVQSQDGDSVIGLDPDDVAIIENAENDDSKVVTKSPPKPYQLGYISVFCIIINKMIGEYSPFPLNFSSITPVNTSSRYGHFRHSL